MGRWSADHWKTATFGWLALVVVAFGIGGMVGTKNPNPNTSGPGESGRMDRILHAGFKRPAAENVLIQSRTATARHAGVRRGRQGRRRPRLDARPTSGTSARRSRPATRIRSPRTGTQRSSSSTSAARSTRRPTRSARSSTPSPRPRRPIRASSSARWAMPVRRRRSMRSVRQGPRQGGDALPADHADHPASSRSARSSPRGSRCCSRSRPCSAPSGWSQSRATCSRWRTKSPALVLLIGLAVGVDYSMFYLRREREERAKGRSERAALEAAAATSGRSVLISGLTVMVAMAGMFLIGDKTFASFGVATMMVVAVAMLGSLTVLPALLSRLGDRVDKVRVPPSPLAATAARAGCGAGSSTASCGGPRCPRRSPAALLLLLALPAIQMRMADPSPDTYPAHARGRQDLQADAAGVPRNGAARERDRQGAERERSGGPRGDLRARAAGARERPRARADHDRGQQGRHGREHHDPDRGQRHRHRRRTPRWPLLRDDDHPRDGRRAPEHGGRRHRADRRSGRTRATRSGRRCRSWSPSCSCSRSR